MPKKPSVDEIVSNPSAERAVLSLCMKKPYCLVECSANNLYAEHFAIKSNKVLYAVICYLTEEGVSSFDSNVIYSTITDVEAKEQIDSIGGRDYIDSLIQSNIIEDNLKVYIRQVKSCATKRFAYQLGIDIQQEVLTTDTSEETTEMINNIQKRVLDLALSGGTESEVYKYGTNASERLTERLNNPRDVFGYQIGWTEFDRLTQGLGSNDLIVVVAPSKVGKSTLIQNWAERLSIASNLKGLYIDTEMQDDEQEDRIISILSAVPFEEIRNGKFGQDTEYGLGEDKKNRVFRAVEILKNSNLFHVYMPDFTIDKVTALIRKYKIQENIDYCIFDYIKMPNSDIKGLSTAQEYQRLGYFTTCLKDMAGICQIPIITACQTNRNDLDNTDPDASDIGGSYRILQLATKLMFLRNKTPQELQAEGYSIGNQKLHIKYQRNGAGDSSINIQFDRPICKMREVH
jgi:replicative DNA helicase